MFSYLSKPSSIANIMKNMANRNFSTTLIMKQAASPADDVVITQEVGSKGIITLNRQKALNALNLEMVRKIYAPLKKWEKSKNLVIVKGAGDKAFCAGGDIIALTNNGLVPDSIAFFREEYTLNHLVGTYKIPYIAIIDGITMGGGVGISVHGQYRIATERTIFAMPETAIGLFPDVGGSYFLPRLNGKLGMFLALTGYRFKGKDVLHGGIATHYCDSSVLPDLEAQLLACSNAKEVDATINKLCPVDNKSKFILENDIQKINECFRENNVENIVKWLETNKSEWATKILETLKKMSPLSMKTTFAQLEFGAKLNLAECLKMEFTMAIRHLENSDFKEGVRAFTQKDKPKWNPATLEEVTDERLKLLFVNYPCEELKLEDREITSKL